MNIFDRFKTSRSGHPAKIKCDSWDTEELDLVFYIQKIWIKQLILGLLKGFYGDSSSTIFCLIKLDFLFLKALCPGGSESLKMVGIYTNTFLPGLPGVPRYLQLLEGGLYYLYINCWGLFQFGNFTLLRQNCILFLSWSLDPLRSEWNTWLLLLTNFNKFLIKLKL